MTGTLSSKSTGSPTTAPSRAVRIGFDARLSLGQYRGMGRFTRMLLAGREAEFFAFCARGEGDPSFQTVAEGPRFYPLWEQFTVPTLVKKFDLEFFLAPYNTGPLNLPPKVKLLSVIYDLIYLESLPLSRSLYQNAGRYYRRYVVPKIARKAHRIVTTSEYTKKQLVSRLGVEPWRVHVIPVALGPEWFRRADREPQSNRFIFAVAGEAPSKNLRRGIQAFMKYRSLSGDRITRLKIAGVKPHYHSEFSKLALENGTGDCVQLLGYVSEEELRGFYLRADLFFMPSLLEGFGIPVLEALASGTPVISSNRTSLPEVGGDAARYFDPESIDDMAAAMREVLSSPDLASSMSQRGMAQALKFQAAVVARNVDLFWDQLAIYEPELQPLLSTTTRNLTRTQ